jgi:murein L,D-transpeptidase YcbB/YkuD
MVHAQIALGETKHLAVKHPIPIHVVYFTSLVRGDDFYMLPDPYHYDETVLDALRRPDPQVPASRDTEK